MAWKNKCGGNQTIVLWDKWTSALVDKIMDFTVLDEKCDIKKHTVEITLEIIY